MREIGLVANSCILSEDGWVTSGCVLSGGGAGYGSHSILLQEYLMVAALCKEIGCQMIVYLTLCVV